MISTEAVHPSRHICAFFRNQEEQHRTLLPYIKEGLERGEKVVHIVNTRYREEYRQRLREEGIDVAGAENRDQLEVLSWAETYLDGGSFHRDAALALVDKCLTKSRAQGFPRTRAIGDMDWFRQNRMKIDDMLTYEARLNQMLAKHENDSVICVYDLSRFSGVAILGAMRTHPAAFIGGILQQNPFYVPPEKVLAELRESA